MLKKTLFVSSLSLVLIGCAPLPVCEPYSGPTPPCMGTPSAPQVTLNTKTLNTTPYCIRAKKGTTIVFRLVPLADNVLNGVEISPKDSKDRWLKGRNNIAKDIIVIPVPETLAPGDHDYGIRTSDKCVDPRIRVEI